MSKLFIDTIIQHSGDLTEKDKIAILNIVSKHINKKMKILEYKYGIQLKFAKLPENNYDCAKKKIGFQTVAQITGPVKGEIPFYTTREISVPTPTVSAITTGIPLNPYGQYGLYNPVVGVPGLAINPFGSNSNKLEDRLKRANELILKLKQIENKLKNTECKDISNSDSVKKYFDCVDLDLNEDNTWEEINNILNKNIK